MYYKEGCATLQTKTQKQVLGILGGLGPAASCYLYQMLIDHTPATCDQDHIDIVISSRASTPDRTAFIIGKSKDDPFAVMEQDGFSLVHYGATVLAIPCNTAHYFYDRLAEALPVPVLNMPRLTVADAKAAGCTKLGILATDGTLAAETYQLACQAQGIDWAVPSEEHQQEVYILPLSSVVESFQVNADDVSTVAQGSQLVKVRDEYMPVIALERIFQVPRQDQSQSSNIMVVVEADGSRVALLVDELLGQHQVVVKNLESNYRKVPNVSGATILGDGTVALILDTGALVRRARH